MKADEYLDQKGLDYRLIEQDNPTKNCDDAARERGVKTRQIVKSLIVERDGERFHCLVPGDRKLSAGKFGENAMLPPEESRKITGQKSGTVHPFSTQLPHHIDETLLEEERLSHTTGETRRGIIIETDSFVEALKEAEFEYMVHDIIETGQRELEELTDQGFEERKAKFLLRNSLRKKALELSEEHVEDAVSDVLQELERKELDNEYAEKILERTSEENRIKKLVESLDQNGSLPEETEYDLEKVVEKVIGENQDAVEDYLSGKESALNYLMGQVMKQTNGRADSGQTMQLLEEAVDEE